MDASALAALITDHRRFPALLAATVEGADGMLLREREAPNRWSPLEILRHLLDEETEDFGARARFLVEGGGEPPRIDPAAWVAERNYNEADPTETLVEFAAVRAVSCDWLATIPLSALANELQITDTFSLKAGDVIAAWRVHDLLHLRQIASAMATITARRLAPWNAAYAGDIPYLDQDKP